MHTCTRKVSRHRAVTPVHTYIIHTHPGDPDAQISEAQRRELELECVDVRDAPANRLCRARDWLPRTFFWIFTAAALFAAASTALAVSRGQTVPLRRASGPPQ